MKEVKIFLSHSSEVKRDVEAVELEIRRIYQKSSDIKLIIEHYSESDKSFHPNGYQERLNEILLSCDILYLFVERRVGKYTEEEFNVAYKSFENRKLPYISVFFKKFSIEDNATEEEWENANYLRKFKQKIAKLQNNQYVIGYNDIEELKLKVLKQLQYDIDKLKKK